MTKVPKSIEEHTRFFIPAAASLNELRLRTLKQDDIFAVFDPTGDATPWPGSPEGIYYCDTRHVSTLYLTIAGERPILLSSTVRNDNATLTCDLTNPDLFDHAGTLLLEHDLLHIRRSRFLWKTTSFERLIVRNYDVTPRIVRLELRFAADFADLFEVRGMKRERHGKLHEPSFDTSAVRLGYSGLDGRDRTTDIRFEPPPQRLRENRAEFEFELQPREARDVFVEIRCGSAGANEPARRAFFSALRDVRRSVRKAHAGGCAIATSNDLFNEAIRRSVADLYLLTTDLPEGPYPYAGIPWFSTAFGRDALITAWEVLWMDPNIARGVLAFLAKSQATEVDPASDAEPGKILHEVRHGEMAELGEVPFKRYYGSVDSTPLFVMLAGAYLRRTGDVETMRALWPNIAAALRWIEDCGDIDGDGFIEYQRRTPNGLVNQGWKDSNDSVFHHDGTLAQGPIAMVEVQAYVYGAYRAAAEIARRLRNDAAAAALNAKADALRAHFDETFFDEELGTYVLALDGEKKRCRVRSSNAGHALFTRIALESRAASVVDALMAPGSFSGWGVRTVPEREPRFNPMSYHNGSVWPHDNAIIAAGFAAYGFKRQTLQIFDGLFAASTFFDLRRLPELFCGFARQRTQGPTPYPVACSPQAWAAGAPIALLGICLDIGFEPADSRINFDHSVLPAFIDTMTLQGLSVAGAKADIRIGRAGDQVTLEVLDREGPVKVVTTK
jgi:glycogen debranching enzyme